MLSYFYLSQGQSIAAKHIEVIIRQMFSRVRIEEPGDTEFISGDVVSKASLHVANQKAAEKGKQVATYELLLMPITKISTGADSWLSAASFQETTRVLIGAAMRGKSDNLRGLKENVIVGRLIPAGTGFAYHKDRQAKRAEPEQPVAPQIDAEQASQDLAALLNAGLNDDN